MKKKKFKSIIQITLFVTLMLLGNKSYEQGLLNNGAKIIIESGADLIVDGDVIIQTESGSNGTFSLEGELKLSGDFTNNNSVAGDVFAVNSGNITFNGSTTQEVNGNAATNFGDMVLANSVEFNSVSQQSVSNINLSGGKLIIGNVDFTVNPNATITNYSTTNYIVADNDGKLIRTINAGNTVFFPIGSGTKYAPVEITQNSSASGADGQFKVRVIDVVYQNSVDGPIMGTHEKYVNKTWYIESTASVLDLSVSLKWQGVDHMNGFNPNTCYIAHYTGGSWDMVSGGNALLTSGLYAISRSTITSLSPFTVADQSSGSLPIELIDFTATKMDQNVIVHWETASETNNMGFNIMRMNQLKSFEKIGFMQGHGNSQQIMQYDFVDNFPSDAIMDGFVYYQLQQVDFDGTTKNSKVVSVSLDNNSPLSFLIFPNPTKDQIQILHNDDEEITIKIFDCSSQLIKQTTTSENRIMVDFSGYAKGVYVLSIVGAKINKSHKIVRE